MNRASLKRDAARRPLLTRGWMTTQVQRKMVKMLVATSVRVPRPVDSGVQPTRTVEFDVGEVTAPRLVVCASLMAKSQYFFELIRDTSRSAGD